jgi:acetylornithine/succinyldiaminopimelate/putrescine aminotransferase
MVGVALTEETDAAGAQATMLSEGLIVNVPGPATLRMLPPLIIGDAEVDEALEIIRRVLG